MEGINLSFKKGQADGKLSGIKVSRVINILHLFFVDDVLIMSKASPTKWLEIEGILSVFYKASGLEVNPQKYLFYTYGVQHEVVDTFKVFFPYNFLILRMV
jgi:hypothetical protein